MIFVPLSILAGFLESTKDAIMKKLSGSMNPYTMTAGMYFSMLLFLLPAWFFIPSDFDSFVLDQRFYWSFGITVCLFLVANILINTALKKSDLSVLIPILNFSTIFTLLFQPIFFENLPSPIALIGVFLILFGSYFLKLNLKKSGIFTPFKLLFKDTGAIFFIFVAFLWGIDDIFGKIGASQTDPIFWTLSTRGLVFLISLPLAFKLDKNCLKDLFNNRYLFLISGVFVAVGVTLINYLLAEYQPAIVSSLLRLSSLFSVLYGLFLFKEKQAPVKIFGGLLMVFGAVLIGFFG